MFDDIGRAYSPIPQFFHDDGKSVGLQAIAINGYAVQQILRGGGLDVFANAFGIEVHMG